MTYLTGIIILYYVKSKLSKRVGIMYRCNHLLNRSSMHILYCSLFLPYLTYCVEIWGNTYPTNINGIVLLQKNISLIMYGAKRLQHTDPFFQHLRILIFLDSIELQTAMFMYKAYYSCLPLNIQLIFV